jgi:cellobiose epimerase
MAIDLNRLDSSGFQKELNGNILPFWMKQMVDKENGGFYGALTNDLQIHNEVPRSAILCARILWTYSLATRKLGGQDYLDMAHWAYDALTGTFLDPQYGGVYWTVDAAGQPVFDRKHHYAQAFAIYGLTEYYRATQEPKSLELAKELFGLLEKHAYDPVHGGYIEGSSRSWETLEDMRLSDRDLNCRKSMNTLLHILEAYSNLMRVWDDATLKARHKALIETFLLKVVDPATGHFKLFFDDDWHSLLDDMSYGHDIEGSWLLVEAAELQGDPTLLERVRETAVRIAEAVHRDGIDPDGSLPYEGDAGGVVDPQKSWWVQAEAVVGFYNAYQLSGQERFAGDAARAWEYIQAKMIDRKFGDWFKRLHRDGSLDVTSYKTGPWECPYHHSRMCFEMIDRMGNNHSEH